MNETETMTNPPTPTSSDTGSANDVKVDLSSYEDPFANEVDEQRQRQEREEEYRKSVEEQEAQEELLRNPPGVSASGLGGEDSFRFKGFLYKLGPIVPKIKAKFEQWCEDNEAMGLERQLGKVSVMTYIALQDRYLDRLGSRHWSYEGVYSLNARRGIEGQKALAFFILAFYNRPETLMQNQSPPWTEKLIEELWQDEFKWKEFEKKIQRLSDPNPTVPNPPGQK